MPEARRQIEALPYNLSGILNHFSHGFALSVAALLSCKLLKIMELPGISISEQLGHWGTAATFLTYRRGLYIL